MLDDLDRDSDEVVVYRLMFELPRADAEQLRPRLGWPEERIRAALDRLAEFSLVRPSAEQPGAVRAVSPEMGLPALLAMQEASLLSRQQQLAANRLTANQLMQEYVDLRQRLHGSAVEELNGLDEVRAHLQQMANRCEQELMAFVPAHKPDPSLLAESQQNDLRTLSRGVRMRTVYLWSMRNNPLALSAATWLLDNGGDVRLVSSLPSRMVIVDRQVAVIPIDPAESRLGALVVRSQGLVTALCALFDAYWREGDPLDDRPLRRGETLSSQERGLIQLLGEGLTDEVIARKMGVSVRTSRRITAELMARVGARSRFQAGLRIAELGWLDA